MSEELNETIGGKILAVPQTDEGPQYTKKVLYVNVVQRRKKCILPPILKKLS
jgi:hypothetical protein